MNLPCSKAYDPSLPRVLLLRSDEELAARQATMVDDIRVGSRARDQRGERPPCRQIKSGMNLLGNRVANRKYRQPTTRSGAWNESIVSTHSPFPHKSTTGKSGLSSWQGCNGCATQSEEDRPTPPAYGR